MPRKPKEHWGTKRSVERASTRTQAPVEQHNVSWEAAGNRDLAREKKRRYDVERRSKAKCSSSSSSSSSSSGGGGGAGGGTARRLASSGVSAIEALHRLTAFRFFDEEDQIQYIVEGFRCEKTSEGGKKGRTFTIRNVDTNELDTMWEDSLLEFLHEARAKAAVRDIEDSEGEVED